MTVLPKVKFDGSLSKRMAALQSVEMLAIESVWKTAESFIVREGRCGPGESLNGKC